MKMVILTCTLLSTLGYAAATEGPDKSLGYHMDNYTEATALVPVYDSATSRYNVKPQSSCPGCATPIDLTGITEDGDSAPEVHAKENSSPDENQI
jgi:hypothetical protein